MAALRAKLENDGALDNQWPAHSHTSKLSYHVPVIRLYNSYHTRHVNVLTNCLETKVFT